MAELSKADPPKRQRRRFQFSLRDLLALVALAALGCAIAFPMIRKWQRIRAIQEKTSEELKAIVKPVEMHHYVSL
jgi:Tfp pilus assembly protein FimT